MLTEAAAARSSQRGCQAEGLSGPLLQLAARRRETWLHFGGSAFQCTPSMESGLTMKPAPSATRMITALR